MELEMRESELMRRIQESANAEPGVRLFRNNCGFDQKNRVRYGLSIGSSDLIGLAGGVFLAIEVKTPVGRERKEQKLFREAINRLGGVAGVARSVDEAMALVAQALACGSARA
jgi:hypothetical protein